MCIMFTLFSSGKYEIQSAVLTQNLTCEYITLLAFTPEQRKCTIHWNYENNLIFKTKPFAWFCCPVDYVLKQSYHISKR